MAHLLGTYYITPTSPCRGLAYAMSRESYNQFWCDSHERSDESLLTVAERREIHYTDNRDRIKRDRELDNARAMWRDSGVCYE